jgi:hypothetical protein
MTRVVKYFVFSPEGYRLLADAIAAAGLRRRERLPEWDDYLADTDRFARGLEGDGVVVQRRLVDVERMLEWLNDHGLDPAERSRGKYVRARYGDSPLRRRRRGVLMAWGDGGDTHLDGVPEASGSDWYARLDASRRAASARAFEERQVPGGTYSPWDDWRSRWAPGS